MTALENLRPFLAAEDIGAVFGTSTRTGRRMLSTGECGATFVMGRRLFVRREVLLAKIAKLEREPGAQPARKPTPVLPRNGGAK